MEITPRAVETRSDTPKRLLRDQDNPVVRARVLAEVEEVVEATPIGGLELKGFGKPIEAFTVSATVPIRA